MPDKPAHAMRGVIAVATPARRPAAREPVRRSVNSAAATAATVAKSRPRPFAATIGDTPSASGTARTSVQSGAVDPELGTPALNEKPLPSATFRANCR